MEHFEEGVDLEIGIDQVNEALAADDTHAAATPQRRLLPGTTEFSRLVTLIVVGCAGSLALVLPLRSPPGCDEAPAPAPTFAQLAAIGLGGVFAFKGIAAGALYVAASGQRLMKELAAVALTAFTILVSFSSYVYYCRRSVLGLWPYLLAPLVSGEVTPAPACQPGRSRPPGAEAAPPARRFL